MTTITLDELRAEVEKINLQKTYPKGFTAKEFCKSMNASYSCGLKRLHDLVEHGHAKFLGNRPVTRMDGRGGVTPVYSLTKPLKK